MSENMSAFDSIAKIPGHVVRATAATTGTIAAAAEVVHKGAELVAETAEETVPAGKYIGKTVVHGSKITSDIAEIGGVVSGALIAPFRTAALAVTTALTPVDRLLSTATIAINRTFDSVDRWVAGGPQRALALS